MQGTSEQWTAGGQTEDVFYSDVVRSRAVDT